VAATPADDLIRPLGRSLALVLAVVVVGVLGYLWIGWPEHDLLDAVYMTIITLTTVGYGEVIDLSDKPGGRMFTVVLLVSGVGAFLNFVSALTAFWVDGQASQLLWRGRMGRRLKGLHDHIVVCGAGNTGTWVCRELLDTRRDFAVVEHDPGRMRALLTELGQEVPVVVGDASDNDALLEAGVDRAAAVVCCVSNDKDNLIVALSVRILAPEVRIICRCVEEAMAEKLRRAGADSVVSPNRIGGLRLISEAVRPAAVDYLDRMLRDRDAGMRVESAAIESGSALDGQTVAHLRTHDTGLQLLAVHRRDDRWEDAPDDAAVLHVGDQVVYTGGPEVRRRVERLVRHQREG